MDLMGVEKHPQSPVLSHQKGMSPVGPSSTPNPIPIPDTGMRAGSKGGSGKGEDRSPEREKEEKEGAGAFRVRFSRFWKALHVHNSSGVKGAVKEGGRAGQQLPGSECPLLLFL